MASEPHAIALGELRTALRRIADLDESRGGPIAPRETPTTKAMRAIAREALERSRGWSSDSDRRFANVELAREYWKTETIALWVKEQERVVGFRQAELAAMRELLAERGS